MSQAKILNAKSVAIDGRLHNVRTRHSQLKRLHDVVRSRQDELLLALIRQYPIFRGEENILGLQVVASLRGMRIHAEELDQEESCKHGGKLRENQKTKLTHFYQLPLGLIGIVAFDLVSCQPIDGILGPLSASVAAGDPALLLLQRGPLSVFLKQVFSASLDRDAYEILEVETSEEGVELLRSCDCVITLGARRGAIDVSLSPGIKEEREGKKKEEEKEERERDQDFVIVDHSLVEESLYRNLQYRQCPPERLLGTLHSVAHVLVQAVELSTKFHPTFFRVLVSELIYDIFESILRSAIPSNMTKVVLEPYTSTEHAIYELSKSSVGNSYIFANEAHGAYLSTQIQSRIKTINCLPIDLLLCNFPDGAIVEFYQGKEKSDKAGLVLKPLWSPHLFSKAHSTVAQPVKSLKTQSSKLLQEEAKRELVPMKRGKADHMEFFPTGFKITAFPTVLLLAMGVGFVGFQGVKQLYHLGLTMFKHS